MATGDVQGSVERLRSELRHIRYPADLDCTGAKFGVAAAFLPVLNYVLLKFSRHVAHQLVSAGYELQGKTDARFIEAAFKIFRDKFGLRPVLTAPQFLEQGFAERKLMLVSDVIAYCKSFHNAAVRRARLAAASAPTKSGKDATTSGKAAASQVSKGSRKSKAKSGLPRAPQQPRVQRHSDAASEADTASAAAALQARLSPSSAQLAHMDQSQSIDPNPWGPSAHALGALSMQAGLPQASHGMAAVPLHGPNDKLSQSAGHQPAQQQHTHVGQSQSRAQGKAGSMPAATQAWFVNPAFGSESPMPSPEKQPRTQGPPMPHPSTSPGYPGGPGPQHTTGISTQQQGLSSVSGHAAVQQASTQQHSQETSGSMSFGPHMAHGQQQATSYMSMHPSHSPGLSGHTHTRLHQQELHRHPAPASLHAPFESNVEADRKPAPSSSSGQGLNATGHQSLQQQHLHRCHMFPSMPARQQQQQLPQQADTSGLQYQAIMQRPATAGYSHTSASSLPPHTGQPPVLHHQGPYQHLGHHHKPQEGQSDGQLQGRLLDQLQGQTVSELQQQQPAQQPQQQQQPGAGRLSGMDLGAYVQGLHQRLAAAEEQAAQARRHGEQRAHTLEARITLLEGRLSFVEGELAAERQRNAAAAQAGDSGGAQRSAEIAVCLSPPAAKPRQNKAAAPHAVSKPPMTTPGRCMDIEASPTRSTAGTPCYRPGNLGVSRQLGLSGMAQQSPARSMRAPAVPASPASSMYSYKSTSELIESIQNRSRQRVSLLVRNLPLDARADEVREKFERFGEIRDVYLPRDYYTGRSRGFGFIEYRDPRDADDAMYRMDGANIGGRDITVVQSKEARKTPREMIVRDGPPARGGGDRGGGRHRSRSPPRHSRRRSYSRSRSPPRRSRGRSYSRSPARSASRSASPRRSPARSVSRSPARDVEGSPRGSPARSISRSPVRD
ncbi:hypothetical protein WJX77_011722 [Trebouxia sp. C0004]